MYGKGTLAQTGAGITVLGFSFSLSMIAGVIATLIVVGAVSYRVANRKKRYVA